jgi:3'(2'), 5'-bisphosphate nucleotidase
VDSLDLPALLMVAEAAARDAAKAILEIYDTDFAVEQKSDRSPVTLADARAEAAIFARLTEATPSFPIISEERAEKDGLPAIGPDRFWLVDPLDGTKEFIKRNGEFTVNIALIEKGRPILGVVGIPAQALLYTGFGHGTARRIDPDGSVHVIACRPCPAEGATVAFSRSHSDADTLEAWLAERKIAGKVAAGSALKFCLVAEGTADLYPRLGRTMEWDTGAGHAVVLAAGGEVLTLDGSPLTYGKPGFDNPSFYARGLSG